LPVANNPTSHKYPCLTSTLAIAPGFMETTSTATIKTSTRREGR
jgi:hypothetical protein